MLSKAVRQLQRYQVAARSFATSSGEAKRVVVTGAVGNISYATLFRIAR
jgi:hypothetical protein